MRYKCAEFQRCGMCVTDFSNFSNPDKTHPEFSSRCLLSNNPLKDKFVACPTSLLYG